MNENQTFDPKRSPLATRMAAGHLMRTGHALTGYYTHDGSGIYTLHRTCACAMTSGPNDVEASVVAP